MNILLFNASSKYFNGAEGTIYPPMGLLYLARAVSNLCQNIAIVDNNKLNLTLSDLTKYIQKTKPAIVGFTINIANIKSTLELTQNIRKNNQDIYLVAGGPLPSAIPNYFLEGFDYVCKGEGEQVFLQIIQDIKNDISGEKLRDGQTIKIKNAAPGNQYGSDCFPGYEYLFPRLPEYSKGARIIKKNMAPLITSRGCPNHCSFCNKSVFGFSYQKRQVQDVMAEVEWLEKNYSVKQLDILDDNFSFDLERAEEILDALAKKKQKLALNFANGLCIDKISEKMIGKMKAAGVFRLGVGIETGSKKVQKSINKYVDLNQAIFLVNKLKKAGITVHANFIIGLVEDDLESIKETISYAIKLNPHYANFALYLPIPGTLEFERAEENGLLKNYLLHKISAGFFSKKTSLNYTALSKKEIEGLLKTAYKIFYLRAGKIYDILTSVKSFGDLGWLIRTSWSVFNNLISKNNLMGDSKYL